MNNNFFIVLPFLNGFYKDSYSKDHAQRPAASHELPGVDRFKPTSRVRSTLEIAIISRATNARILQKVTSFRNWENTLISR